MERFSFDKLKDMQKAAARQASLEPTLEKDDIKYVAGFDIAYRDNKCVVAAVVFDFKTLKIVEKKHLIAKAPMNYVPGFLAFRAGPPICQIYYDLEYEPDILMIEGSGLAHPEYCGLATFVGVELGKPAIGVAKNLLAGDLKGDDIILEGEIVGKQVKTREYANPVLVSPGHMMSVELAADIVKHFIVPPHKMPEPIHVAHRHAKKMSKELKVTVKN